MTAPQEPLKLTFEEAVALLAEQGVTLTRDGTGVVGRSWSIRPWSPPELWMVEVLGATWADAVSEALGRPVVALDPAAELRALASEWAHRMDETHYSPRWWEEPALTDLMAATHALRAALAATEGQP